MHIHKTQPRTWLLAANSVFTQLFAQYFNNLIWPKIEIILGFEMDFPKFLYIGSKGLDLEMILFLVSCLKLK